MNNYFRGHGVSVLGTTCLSTMAVFCALSISTSDVLAAEKAQKMKLGIEGEVVSVIAFGNQDGAFESTAGSTTRTGYDSLNIWNDSEIHFKGESKLNNGLTVAVTIELEADAVNGGSTIDDSFISLGGSFGELQVGSTGGASNQMANAAPSVGVTGPNDGDGGYVIIAPSAVGVTADTHVSTDSDMKIFYMSPSISGFQLGASYKPSNNNTDSMPATGGTAGTEVQEYNVALAYGGKMGSIDVGADIGYAENHGPATSSNKGWRAGLVAKFGAVSVGGSYREFSEIDNLLAGTANSPEEEAFDIGLSYESGPWAVSATYLNVAAPKSSSTAGDDESTQMWVGASYNLGPGVNLLGNVFRIEWSDEGSADADNNDGWGALGGISVSF